MGSIPIRATKNKYMQYEVTFTKEDKDEIKWLVLAENKDDALSKIQSRIQMLEQTSQFIDKYDVKEV